MFSKQVNFTAVAHVEVHSGPFSMCCSHNGKFFITAAVDGSIKVWETQSRKQLTKFEASASGINNVCITPDDTMIITSGGIDNKVKIWNVSSYILLQEITFPTTVFSCSVTPNGKNLLVALASSIEVFVIPLFTKCATYTQTDGSNFITFSPDSKFYGTSSANNVKIFHKSGSNVLAEHKDVVLSVCFSQNSQTLATASKDNQIKIWNLLQFNLIATLVSHNNDITGVVMTPYCDVLVSVSKDKTIKIWDYKTYVLLNTIAEKAPLSSCQISQDGQLFFACGLDGFISIYTITYPFERPASTFTVRATDAITFTP